MSPNVLDEALRYGSRRTYEVNDLGKYGLGLKTASLSQCRRLTVATRRGLQRRRLHVRCWDLDHVVDVDEWQLIEPYTWEWEDRFVAPLEDHPGTVVLWEGLDRLLTHRRPDGQHARNAFSSLADQVASHLGMTFHRLLAGETDRRAPIRIVVNGEEVKAGDPFARMEPRTQELAPQYLDLPGTAQPIVVRPFILPREGEFTSSAARPSSALLSRLWPSPHKPSTVGRRSSTPMLALSIQIGMQTSHPRSLCSQPSLSHELSSTNCATIPKFSIALCVPLVSRLIFLTRRG
jgi:hypothetical protein